MSTMRNRGFSFLTDIEEDTSKTIGTKPSKSTDNRFEFDETEPVKFLEGDAENKKVVISLDFGSTHSGFSYALTSTGEIKCDKKKNGLYKEPTCALFDSTGELVAFGIEAREQYVTLMAANSVLPLGSVAMRTHSEGCLYFDYNKLKMRLYTNEMRSFENLTARSASGQEVSLEKLVAAILEQLKIMALKGIQQNEGIKIAAKDALWVLTVPAIWLEVDKQFMRSAAVAARIIPNFKSSDLILALEPECAAIRLHALKQLELDLGTKVLILDCGGGTVDFCAIQVTSGPNDSHKFRTLLEPNGGDWGATYIDDNFFKLLKKLFGKEEYHTAMISPSVHHEIHTTWEQLKLKLRARHFDDVYKGVWFELKSILIETGQKLPALVKTYNSVHKHQLKCRGRSIMNMKSSTRLILTPEILRTLFDPIVRKIVAHTNSQLEKPEMKDLKHIILVGGFGQCDYLKSQLSRRLFNSETSIIVPKESSSVVMKGAVEFGLHPSVIETRKSALTIGVKGTIPFDKTAKYDKEDLKHKKYDKKSKMHVMKDCLIRLVNVGQEVRVDEKVAQVFHSKPGQTSIKFDIYATRHTDVAFVTDHRCLRLAKLVIPVDPTLKEQQTFKCSLTVGFTEMFATVSNEQTGMSDKILIEFNKTGDNAIIIDHATPSE